MIGWRSKDQDLRTVMVKIGENAGRQRNILNQAQVTCHCTDGDDELLLQMLVYYYEGFYIEED